jgi:EmrB/QacA subfamily drug resistance transporter
MRRIGEAARPWWLLAGACAGLFVLMLDSTVVNLALPAVQADLRASDSELQWVMNAYLLVITALIVSAGRLGDIAGRKRVFQIGMGVFLVGSVLSALAPSPLVLIAGRVVQAVGAAAVLALSLAIVSRAFGDESRPRALGIWASVSAVALGVGPLLGGVLIEHATWRWIFWINVPICLAGLAITAVAASESRDETAERRLDLPGMATLGLGLTGIVLALVEAQSWGWGSPATLLCLGGGIALMAAFWFVEHRVRHPIVDFGLFRNGPYFGASMAGFALVGSYWGLIFYEPQYLQNILGHSALAAGLLVLPLTAPMMVVSPFTGRLARVVGVRPLMTLGMLCGTVGVVVLTQVGVATGYGVVLVGYLLFGIALGIVYATMSTAAMEAMPSEKAGIASGVLAMNRVLAGTLVLAVLGAIVGHLEQDRLAAEVAAHTDGVTTGRQGELDGLLAGSRSALDELRSQPADVVASVRRAAADAFMYALGHALWAVVALLVAGTVLTAVFVRGSRSAEARRSRPPAHHWHHHRAPL